MNGSLEPARGWVPFAFEQQHVFNAAVSYRFPANITLGAVFHFNTGRPESGEISSRTQLEGLSSTGQPVWIPADRDRVDRLPAYYRIDVRASKTWTFDLLLLDLYLDVMNATFSQEVLGYSYYLRPDFDNEDAPRRYRKEPIRIPLIVPMLGMKATF